ncbi:MAG TPA: aminotransferase class III-fold pyridoxal phosphate-dependent enzyme, partial [Gammaproteobacteria bacterium]|nr:aminotransferase class III-fold pyridoxal phosphate-dependent enzyme [Gammaproteobacteria bacterium]
HEILMIYDEVMTGFGRTGATFACEKANTTPDIICLAKGLTGGFLPLAVTACHEAIYQAFLSEQIDRALIHGHSYTANPLSCAAALASLELLRSEATIQQIRMIEATHQQMLGELSTVPGVEKMRHCGTLAAFDLAIPEAYGSRESQNWRDLLMKNGLIIRPLGKTIYLMPPYCIQEDDLRKAYTKIKTLLENSIK